MPPLPTQTRFEKGIAIGPLSKNAPTAVIDKDGNARFNGQVSVGSLRMVDGGTLGVVMDNNEFLSGLTTTNVAKRMIGVNTSNQVSIDPDAAGAVFGGTATFNSTTAFVGTLGIPDGSAPNPGIHFTSDLSGIYLLSAGRMIFAVGGATNAVEMSSARLKLIDSAMVLDFAGDAFIARDAAAVLALKDGTTPQELRVYGSTTGPKYIRVYHDGTDSQIKSQFGDLYLTNNGAGVQVTSGNPVPTSDNGLTLGSSSRRWSNIFGTAFTVGTTTAIATTGSIRTAASNAWIGRDAANSNDRNVIAWGVTTVNTVILGNPSTDTDINASTLRINGQAGATGSFANVVCVKGIVISGT